jgi:hypothetical protein
MSAYPAKAVCRSPGVVAGDGEREREPADLVLGEGEGGPRAGVLDRLAASVQAGLEFRPIFSEVVPQSREPPPLRRPEDIGES